MKSQHFVLIHELQNSFFAGEEHVYAAIEEGDVKGCSGKKELHLKITSTVRKEVLRLAANPSVQEALKQAEEEKGKTFDKSPAGVGIIRYIAGWCLFKLMKERKKGIMSTMYNRSKVHITEKLIREKEIIEHLEIS
ncbi:Hypothetical predicted protein [Mytilus galloprovincialis]|uniref:Uncharacterized protein n=1 Tax=Mytilus galloprovincialis TaxID=29158 RepID=A0A8B6GBK8_MYTGA|nr:Hypothetical predicted protein [Mytilus galloprovincialis]